MRGKLLIAMLFVIILPIGIAQNEQSHPLSEIKPINTNLDMFKFNITNVTFIGINLTNPQYALDVAGDVRWSGTLRGGIVPWNLINGYNLSVNWTGKLGWGNLTNYPSIITSIGSGLNASTQSLSGNVILGVNFTEVQRRVTGSCSGSNAIRVINADGSVDCVDINLYGNVTGTGISGYIPLWQTSSSLNNSLINQTNGNIWITSGNLNILLGGLQIGGTSVITSGRSIINVYDVNATRFFQNGVQVIDTINAGSGISITGTGNSRTISNTGVLSLTAGNGISLNASTGNILINNTGILGINVNAPLTSTGGQIPTLGFNYNTTAFSIVNNALTLADAYFTGAAYDSRFVNEGQANSITTSMIVDGAIINPKIALNAVNYSQIQQVSCPAGQALQVIGGGNYTCVDVNPSGIVSGSGTVGYIPLWNGTYSLNNSIIYQSGGKIGIGTTSPVKTLEIIGDVNTTGSVYSVNGYYVGTNQIIDSSTNANFASLKIGGNTVIDSSRNIINVNWVNATNLNASNTVYATVIRGATIYQGANQVIDTINANAPLSSSKTGGSVTISLTTPLALNYGGTGASDATGARVNLQASGIGNCPQGYAVMNLTTGAPQCIPVATPSNANVTGAGSPGQIAFWIGNSVLSGDGSLIWDNSAKRLGISVSSPQAKLHVGGDVIIDV